MQHAARITFSPAEEQCLYIALLLSSVISGIGALVIVAARLQGSSHTPIRRCIVFWLAVSDFAVGVVLMIEALLRLVDGFETVLDEPMGCTLFGALLHFFSMASVLWMGCYAAHLAWLVSSMRDSEPHWHVPTMHASIWVTCGAVCAWLYTAGAFGFSGVYCWIRTSHSIGWLAYYVPLALALLLKLAVDSIALVEMAQRARVLRQDSKPSFSEQTPAFGRGYSAWDYGSSGLKGATRRNEPPQLTRAAASSDASTHTIADRQLWTWLRRTLRFALFFGALAVAQGGSRIYQLTHGGGLNFPLAMVQSIASPLGGLVDVIVFGPSSGVWARLCACGSCCAAREVDDDVFAEQSNVLSWRSRRASDANAGDDESKSRRSRATGSDEASQFRPYLSVDVGSI